tara:strand:+ start:217 stop:795 length:579 start_codon:yes stop_codon:yes gene_type:complete
MTGWELFIGLVFKGFRGAPVNVIFVILIASLFGALLFLLMVAGRKTSLRAARERFISLFCIIVIGGVVGYSGGLSRESAVGEIIPAVLSLLGGLAVYIFGGKRSHSVLVSAGAAAFAIAMLWGFSFGAAVRSPIEFNDEWRKRCDAMFFNAEALKATSGQARQPTLRLRAGDRLVDRPIIDICAQYWISPAQ